MTVLSRLRTVSGIAATASAVMALLVGGTLAVSALNLLLLIDPCIGPDGQRYGFCDPPRPPTVLGWMVIGLLLAAALSNLWKRWLSPLAGAWALVLCLSLADTVLFLIPALRERAGVHDAPDAAGLLATQLSQPFFLASIFGLLLALAAMFSAHRES